MLHLSKVPKIGKVAKKRLPFLHPSLANGVFTFPERGTLLTQEPDARSFLLAVAKYGEVQLPTWWYARLSLDGEPMIAPPVEEAPWSTTTQGQCWLRTYELPAPMNSVLAITERIAFMPTSPGVATFEIELTTDRPEAVFIFDLGIWLGAGTDDQLKRLQLTAQKVKSRSVNTSFCDRKNGREVAITLRHEVTQDGGELELRPILLNQEQLIGHRLTIPTTSGQRTVLRRFVAVGETGLLLDGQLRKAVKSAAKNVQKSGVRASEGFFPFLLYRPLSIHPRWKISAGNRRYLQEVSDQVLRLTHYYFPGFDSRQSHFAQLLKSGTPLARCMWFQYFVRFRSTKTVEHLAENWFYIWEKRMPQFTNANYHVVLVCLYLLVRSEVSLAFIRERLRPFFGAFAIRANQKSEEGRSWTNETNENRFLIAEMNAVLEGERRSFSERFRSILDQFLEDCWEEQSAQHRSWNELNQLRMKVLATPSEQVELDDKTVQRLFNIYRPHLLIGALVLIEDL